MNRKKLLIGVTAILMIGLVGFNSISADEINNNDIAEIDFQAAKDLPYHIPDYLAETNEAYIDEDAGMEVIGLDGEVIWSGTQGEFLENDEEIRELIKEETGHDF
ncbi:hypothetical protein AB3N04_00100 (plasmid) [Alkalihalophilus sp. As8PL]|uniref:Uncharacterized protein n=1 Tax=Alkalihalophilus sp. As8PL TaxID=3237103 RepID=A0AB39BN90_9BACI